jgi:hypothetical protein
VRLGLDDADAARLEVAGQADEGRQVVDVLQALANRLENDGEAGELSSHVEQLSAALTLLPER